MRLSDWLRQFSGLKSQSAHTKRDSVDANFSSLLFVAVISKMVDHVSPPLFYEVKEARN